jgi:hypothetical protein
VGDQKAPSEFCDDFQELTVRENLQLEQVCNIDMKQVGFGSIFQQRLQLFTENGVEVCTGPGQVSQIMFGFRPGSNDSNQTFYRTFRAFLGHFFRKEKFIRNCSQLRKKKGRFHLPPRAAFVSGFNFFDIFQHILKCMSLFLKLFALLWYTNRDVLFTQTHPPKLS